MVRVKFIDLVSWALQQTPPVTGQRTGLHFVSNEMISSLFLIFFYAS